MTLSRLIPLHIHGALEAALAALIMAAPILFGFSTSAMLVSLGLGAVLFGVALLTHAGEQSALPISTHAALDVALSLAMASGAVALGVIDERMASALLAAGALLLVLLASLTRYSPSRV
jgi:hypothetical protein